MRFADYCKENQNTGERQNYQYSVARCVAGEMGTTSEILRKGTQVALREERASLNLGGEEADDLPTVIADMEKLPTKIIELTEADMDIPVVHRLWQFTAFAAVVH